MISDDLRSTIIEYYLKNENSEKTKKQIYSEISEFTGRKEITIKQIIRKYLNTGFFLRNLKLIF